MLLAAIHFDCERAPVRMAQRGLERLGQSLLDLGAHLEAVDHNVDRVLHVARELGREVQFVYLAVDTHARESLRAQFFEQILLLTLAAGDHRGDDHQPRIHRQGQRVVDHLRHGLRLQRQVVVGAIRRADARVQQAQVVVDFGDRADRRARVVAGRLLLDRDCG